MLITLTHQGQTYRCDLSRGLDISMPLAAGAGGVNCFYAPYMDVSPVRAGDFVGAVKEGGVVNFMNVRFNPHGNGTHTECVGHISAEPYTINQQLRQAHHMAWLISVFPQRLPDGDRVVTRAQLEELLPDEPLPPALVLRTLPNDDLKLRTNYSGANPPYLHHEAVAYLCERGVEHLLLDLPSVDRESDGGLLLSHRAFWGYPGELRPHNTITELIYVPNGVKDGLYLLNLQIAPFEVDASPSKPVLYAVEKL